MLPSWSQSLSTPGAAALVSPDRSKSPGSGPVEAGRKRTAQRLPGARPQNRVGPARKTAASCPAGWRRSTPRATAPARRAATVTCLKDAVPHLHAGHATELPTLVHSPRMNDKEGGDPGAGFVEVAAFEPRLEGRMMREGSIPGAGSKSGEGSMAPLLPPNPQQPAREEK